MNQVVQKSIEEALSHIDVEGVSFSVEYPSDISHGDYASNVALVVAKQLNKNPREVAEEIVKILEEQNLLTEVSKIEIAGPGFINFFLTQDFFSKQLKTISESDSAFGKNKTLLGQKILIEFTDPNPFKQFHIGHVMSNTIGETLSRIAEWNGAEVKRACYQGDVGMHVAAALWAMIRHEDDTPDDDASYVEKASFLGQMYAEGATALKEDPQAKEEIQEINTKVFEQSDKKINELYQKGRQWSLDAFDSEYARLGTKFDYFFFESQTASKGKEVVEQGLSGGIFEKSDGAIIYKGEDEGLHTRVFINSKGLPTYEAKELGLAHTKFETYPYDRSVIITGNEVDDYFKVLLHVMSKIYPELAEKTEHMSHGMLRLPTGKMSSRTGDVITAEEFISSLQQGVAQKTADRNLSPEAEAEITKAVAVGAIKYTILKQSIGKNIIFDQKSALSFEGDSGPYIQYTHTRTQSLLKKGEEAGIKIDTSTPDQWETTTVEHLLHRFPEIIERAYTESAPQLIVNYVTEVASAFNSFYAEEKIVDENDSTSSYRLAITQAVGTVLHNGLEVLGISTPTEM